MQILSIKKKKRIHAIAFSPSGRELAGACGDGQLRVWDLSTGEVRQSAAIEETSSGYDIAYLDESRLLFAGIGLRWWDIPGNGWNTIAPGLRWGRQLCLSPDGRHLAETDQTTSTEWSNPGLYVYDTATWKLLPSLEGADDTTGGVAFSPDGRRVATGHIVRVGDHQRSIGFPAGGPRLAFTVPDYDYVVRIREFPAGHVVGISEGWQQGVSNLAFSPDGRVLAGTAGPRLRVWDLAGERELALQKRGTKHFQGLCFTADGRHLLTVSNDTTVRVWSTDSWQEHTTFTWEIGKLLNIAFAPDGCRAAAGSDAGKVIIWDVDL
jgi:WD40 repeat protein